MSQKDKIQEEQDGQLRQKQGQGQDQDQDQEQPQNNEEQPEKQKEQEAPTAEATAEEETKEAEAQKQEKDPAAEWEAKYNEINDKYLRLYSEFENFRRRTAKERMELTQSAGASVVGNLLPIMDDFDRAVQSNEEVDDPATLREGFKLIHKRMEQLLEQSGVEEMKAVGEDFDTDRHEAIANIPAPKKKQKGKVVEETEKGYYYKGKILRFAKVVVGQ